MSNRHGSSHDQKRQHHQRRGRDHPNPIRLPSRVLEIRLVFPPHLTGEITERPAKNKAYTLEVGALKLKGTTNDQGILREAIPDNVTSGKLIIDIWTICLEIGDLAPVDSPKGAKARLNNLGLGVFGSKDLDDTSDHRFWRAVERFMARFGVGKDPAPIFPASNHIKEVYGS